VKRFLDLTVASIVLLASSPLLLLIAIAVRATLGRPVFFRQERAGHRGRPFLLLKFRTMTNDAGPDGRLLPDGDRLTRLGGVLRRTSLDELPELWNVLRGEMSLVGPRPLLVRYLPLYDSEQARRHEILPGLTGWAQIHGRNALSWERRFALDVWYVDNRSLWLDLRILVMTLMTVIRGDGVRQQGQATMEEFRGTAKS
jgi:sugar transferase EpsL